MARSPIYYCISCDKILQSVKREVKEGTQNIIKLSETSKYKGVVYRINICDRCIATKGKRMITINKNQIKTNYSTKTQNSEEKNTSA